MNYQELFTQFCNGISKSVEQVYELSYSTVEKMVLKNNGNKKDAEDIFQETLLVLLKYCERNLILSTALTGFVYSISRNLWLKNLKKNKSSEVTFIDIQEYTIIESQLKEEEKYDTRKYLKALKHINLLPSKGQQIIKAFYIEGKSLDQITEEMGYANKASLKVQKAKFLKRLRDSLKSDDE